ncbi:DUF7342 family protein [Halobaculum roseum]|uniref:Uncharacterized protein n=1 Tax=Halobaculum roseum TaxID=2175149 RepID=A0ABD5MR31_9EURY|nr:hypothetical protein [Halobaculum roseum]
MSESPRDGVQSWTESMSARDRIRAVAETLRELRSVNWISEQADAAWSTTNEELQDLVDQGQLRRVDAGETTRYQPDYTRLLFEEIRTLIEENTREELRNELAAITQETEEWRSTYDVVRAELEAQIERLGDDQFATFANETLVELEERYAVTTPIEARVQELTNRYYRGLEVLQVLDEPMTVDELAAELELDTDEVRDRIAYLTEFDRVSQDGETVSPTE